MPLRLTANDKSLSGHQYDDVLGVRYEFPSRYRGLVREGERFVYYRGRRRSDGTTGRQVYLGVGIVGTVRRSTSDADHWVCDIEDWQPFAEPLYFKDSTDTYYEAGGVRGGLYWQQGVKHVPEDVFVRILRDAGAHPPSAPPGRGEATPGHRPSGGYASPALLAEVAMYAVEAAEAVVRGLWPGSSVAVQPHNNPGFDLVVSSADRPERYVEVKGTTLPFPRFFLSEGERRFAGVHRDAYTLLVIHSIDLDARTHGVFQWDGAIADDRFVLTPRQWACEPKQLPGNWPGAVDEGQPPS